jgi:hypothetical protein
MRRFIARAAAFAIAFAATTATAGSVFVDFSGDATAAVANGFISSGAGSVSFYDSVGADLFVGDFGAQSFGQALAIPDELDGSGLEMRFAFNADLVSLAFGNDDPLFTNPGDLAVLAVYSDLILVGRTTVALNRDDVMNQTISFGADGGALHFNRATFAFTDPFLQPFTGGGSVVIGSTEVVDNVTVNAVVVAIPEPSTALLLIPGLLLIGAARLRKTAGRE